MGCCNEPAAALATAAPDPSQHVNYAKGMVLGVDDFTQEFAYLSGRDRWLAREALGYGTASGLRVLVDDGGDEGPRLYVSAGTALTPGGRLVCVPADQCAVVNRWLAKPENAAVVTRLLNPESPPVSPPASPPASPDVTAGNVSLYLVLCWADCLTRPVPIPGEPCRASDELMAPSRVADDFRLELRERAPEQVEEDALRDFVRWLRANVELVEASPAPEGGDEAWLQALRPAAAPWLEAAAASPPLSPPASYATLGDYLKDLEAPVQVAPARLGDFIHAAFRFWVTELRPLWMAYRCHHPVHGDTDCVLLARVEAEVAWSGGSPSGAWQLSGDAGAVALDETTRPFLAHQRLLQEWVLCGPLIDVAAAGASAGGGGSGGGGSDGVSEDPGEGGSEGGGSEGVSEDPGEGGSEGGGSDGESGGESGGEPGLDAPQEDAAAEGAPADAAYIVASAHAGLPGARSLGEVGTGLLMNTAADGTGTLSVAAAGTDYYAPGAADVAVADGGTGTSAAPGDGQLLIGGGGGYTPASLTGVPNRITITNGPGSIQISTPQDLGPGSSPRFAGLSTSGGVRIAVALATEGMTLEEKHHLVVCGPGITRVALPAAAPRTEGRVYIIKNAGPDGVEVSASGRGSIDGASTTPLRPGDARTVVSDGKGSWLVISTVM